MEVMQRILKVTEQKLAVILSPTFQDFLKNPKPIISAESSNSYTAYSCDTVLWSIFLLRKKIKKVEERIE